MTQPRLSIITPNAHGARHLERTICSVLDQGGASLEYLVVDFDDSDQSTTILKTYEDALTWWTVAPDTPPGAAINEAIGRARGEVVGILPAGDLYLPETLLYVSAHFEQAEAPQWLVGHGMRIGEHDEETGWVESAAPTSAAGYLMHDDGLLPMSMTFYRRDVLEAHGVFDARMHHAFDYELHCRLLAAGVKPTVAPHLLTAKRDATALEPIEQILASGREYVEAAMRHSEALPWRQRTALWHNIDQRRRIYALAEAEAADSDARRMLWQRLLHHPWWLADAHYRHALLHGTYTADQGAAPMPAA